MAQGEKERPVGREELVTALEMSRSRLSSDLGHLVYELDFKSKLKRSIRSNAKSWVSGAAATGLVLSLLPRRRKKVVLRKDEKGKLRKVRGSTLPMETIKVAFPLLKPLLLALVAKKMNNVVSRIEKD